MDCAIVFQVVSSIARVGVRNVYSQGLSRDYSSFLQRLAYVLVDSIYYAGTERYRDGSVLLVSSGRIGYTYHCGRYGYEVRASKGASGDDSYVHVDRAFLRSRYLSHRSLLATLYTNLFVEEGRQLLQGYSYRGYLYLFRDG